MGNIPVGESIGGAQANPKKPWMKSLWSLGPYKNGVVEYEHPGWEYWIMLLFWIYIYTYLHTYISTIGPLVLIVIITTGTIVIILVITKMKIQTIYVAVTMNNHDCGWLSLLPLVFIHIYIFIYPKLWKCWWGKWWPLDVGLPGYSIQTNPLDLFLLM